MQALLIGVGLLVFVVALLGFSAMSDASARRRAGSAYGAAAGVVIGGARESPLLAERLASTRWRRAARVGINHGRYVLDQTGLHWFPSFLTGKKVPAFEVAWNEIASHSVKPGPKLIGRRVAHLRLILVDGTQLQFATVDPDGLAHVLARARG